MSNGQAGPQWDNDETRLLVHACYGTDQLMLLRPAMRAVSYRLAHARYHHQEYLRIVESHMEAQLKTGGDIWEITAPTSDEEAYSHSRFYIECEAHLYACVQAIHAVADNLAHLVYYGLGLNLKKGPRLHVSLSSLETYLSKLRQSDPTLIGLAALLTELKVEKVFIDLSHLVNQLKHHGGPSISLALEPSPEQVYEVRFADFLRGDRWHTSVVVDQFLADSFRILNVAVVDAGIALNVWLGSASSQKCKCHGEGTEPTPPDTLQEHGAASASQTTQLAKINQLG